MISQELSQPVVEHHPTIHQLLATIQETGSVQLPNGLFVSHPQESDFETIAALISQEAQAVIQITPEEIAQVSALKHNLVATDQDTGRFVVGYQAFYPIPEYKLIELRSAVVHPELRGKGINTTMKKLAMQLASLMYPEYQFMGFTEDKSKSRTILHKLGFTEKPMEEVGAEWPHLADICPQDCFIKNGHPCGCKVFTHPTYE